MKTPNMTLSKFLLTSFVAVSASAPAWAAEGDCRPTPASTDAAYGSFVSAPKAFSMGVIFPDLMQQAINYFNVNPNYPVTVDLTDANGANIITVATYIENVALDGIKGTYELSPTITAFYPILFKTCYDADVTIGDGFNNAHLAALNEFILRWDAANFPVGKSLTATAQGLHNKRIGGDGLITMSSASYGGACDVSAITAPLSIPLAFSVTAGGNFTLRPLQIAGTTFSGAGTTTVKGPFAASQSLVSSVTTNSLVLANSSVGSGATLTVTPAQANNQSVSGAGTVSLDGGEINGNISVAGISADVVSSTGSFSVNTGGEFTITAANASNLIISGAGATTISGNVAASADFTGIATTLNIEGSVNEGATLTITSGQGNGRSLGGSGTIAISAASSNLAGNTNFRGLTTSGFSFNGSIEADKTLSINAAQQSITVSGAGSVSILGTEESDVITAANISAKRSVDGLGGADTLSGSAAADTFNGGTGDDSISGGLGNDRAVYSDALGSISSSGSVLTVTTEVDGMDSVSGVETLSFANGDVVVIGNGGSIADLNAALAFSSTAKIFGVCQVNSLTPFSSSAQLSAILARRVAGEGSSLRVDMTGMSPAQVAAVAANIQTIGLANIDDAIDAINASSAADMDDALTVSGIIPDEAYLLIVLDRQLAVRNDLVSNRGTGYESVSATDALFTKLVAFRTATQAAVNGANEGPDITAADFSSGGRIVAVYNAMVALGDASLNGEPINAPALLQAINTFNALNLAGQASMLGAINAGGYISFTQLVMASQAAFPATQLANLNGAENVDQMIAAFAISGYNTNATYVGLAPARQSLTAQDMLRKRGSGYASNDAAADAFGKSVAVYSAVQTVVDSANAGTYTVAKLNGLYVALLANGGVASGDPNTSGLQASDVAFSISITSALSTDGLAALNAAYVEAPDFGSLTALSNASAVILGITPTSLAQFGQLVTDRQTLVFTDLGNANSLEQVGPRFVALTGARLSIQIAVNAANANSIVAADFSAGGKIVAVRDGMIAVEAQGLFLNGDPAANAAAMTSAINSFNALNDFGRAEILLAMNVTTGEPAFTSFTGMSLAAQAAYPAAVLANLNGADSENLISAFTIAQILPDAGYTALSEARQGQVQTDFLNLTNRPEAGFASVAAGDTLFGQLVGFRAASGVVIDAANGPSAGDITAADFSGTGRMVAARNAKAAAGSSSLVGEAITLATLDAFIADFNALGTDGKNVILGAINGVTGGGFASLTQLVAVASAEFPRAVGRDLIAAGISSSNSVDQINQAVLYAVDNEINVDATNMDNPRLQAVANGYVKVNAISGTMNLNKFLDTTTLGRLLGEAAADSGSTVNVDATGMSPLQLDVLTAEVNIGKVDSITGLVLASTETDAQITALLGKVAAGGATAVATDMLVPQLNALSGAFDKLAGNSITGTMMVDSGVTGLGNLLDKTAAGASVQVNASGFDGTGKGTLVSKSSKVDSIWNLTLAVSEDETEIDVLLGLSIDAVSEGKAMAVALATGMNQLQLGALGADAAKIGSDGITGTLAIDSTVANLGALLGATSAEEATVNVDASNFSGPSKDVLVANSSKVDSITNLALASSEDAGDIATLASKCAAGSVSANASGMDSEQKGALVAEIGKISAITNLSVDSNESDAELTALFTKSSGVAVNAASMGGPQKGVVALNAAKVSGITNLSLASSEDAGEIAALVALCGDGSVAANASGMESDQKGALVAAIGKILAISNLSVDSNESDAELTTLFTKSSSVAVNAAGMGDLQKDVLALNVLKISGITGLALASSEDATEIAALLGKCGNGSASANATSMVSDQKGALATGILKLSSITNLSVDSNEDETEIAALFSKCADDSVSVNASGMSSLQKGAVATGIAKASVISNLSVDSNENDAELAALFTKSSSVAVNAAGMGGAQKGVLALNVAKISGITSLTLEASEDPTEIAALLGKVADGSALVDATGMGAPQFNAIGFAIDKIAADGIDGAFTLDAGVEYLSVLFGKIKLSAVVTVNAENMSPTQLDVVGNNVDKIDNLINLTIVADASLTIEALTDLMTTGTNIIVDATNMTPAQLNVVAANATNVATNGVRGEMVLNKDVDASTLSALLAKTSELQAAVNADASLMSNAHLSAMSSNISKVDSIVNLTLTSAQVAGEITNLLTKATAALATATNMDATQLNALAASASIAKIAANGISGTVLLVSGVTDASITSLMTKIPTSTTVRVNGTGMNSVTLKLIVTFDSQVDTAYNLALSNDLTGAELSNLLGKSDAASATVNATNMDSAATGKLSVIAANIAKVISGGISGAIVIDSRLAAADIGAVLSKVSTAASFVGSSVSIDATGMSGAQLSSIATAVNALSSATASALYSMDNLTLTSAQGSSVIAGLILITNPGEAAVVATGMDAAQLSGLGVYGAAIGAITGTVNITSDVSAAAITAIMNTSVASGAFVNVDPTGFGTDQINAYNAVLSSQALMIVGAQLTGSTGETFVKAGETVVIRVEAKNLATRAVGAQGRVNYDASKLTFSQIRQGTGVSADNFMPTLFPGSVAGSAGGQSYVTFYTGIDYTNGANIGQTNGIVAEIEFIATTDGFCKVSNLASLNQSFVNRLVTAATPTAPPSSISVIPSAGMEVSALKDLALTGVPAGVADASDNVANISYYADAGTVLGTVVTDPGVTAANNCSSRPVSIAITFPNASTSSTWPARFPVGTSRVVWSSSDEAGNATSSSRDIVVINKQLLTAEVDLGGAINASLSYTQSIRFRLSSGDVVNATVSYSGANGTVLDVEIPVRDDYSCVSAKDGDHTLAASQSMPVVGTKYVPAAGFSLRGGDSNDDNLIDILDFGIFVTDRSVLGSPVKTADSRSNFDRNGVVNNIDFTFISLGFLMTGDTCGGGYANGNGPIARISVKELRRRGMGEIAQGDLNGDGWVDQFDVALAAEGRYRNNPEQADDAEVIENPIW